MCSVDVFCSCCFILVVLSKIMHADPKMYPRIGDANKGNLLGKLYKNATGGKGVLDFHEGQEVLTSVEWILRAVVGFFFLVAAAKTMGQRSISQLRFLDFVIALILGNIIAHPLSDEQLELKGSMITTATLIVLYIGFTWLSTKWFALQRFLDPAPIPLIREGKIDSSGLAKARITVGFLFSELRKEKVEDIKQVALAMWEPGGVVSIFMDSPHQPVTPDHMKLPSKPFTFTMPIVVDGKADKRLLKQLGKDEAWLAQRLKPQQMDIKQVSLATIDNTGNVQVHGSL
jgi:uncharacterized membrane protein YcaP (DUF421 family)